MSIDQKTAIAKIQQIFKSYLTLQPKHRTYLKSLNDGKLYELFALSHVVQELTRRGYRLKFPFKTLQFKSSPGKLNPADPHFEVYSKGNAQPSFWLYVDIEFQGMGSKHVPVNDRSLRHEIDIV